MTEEELDNFCTGFSSKIVRKRRSWLETGNKDVSTVWE